ncbi:hypothetical protein [Idiomarina sp.]|uniref:hypothetical protein n=1 Tax=Idiomarina sp. TaxID=1874361 RepID=UPI0025BC2E53|nr:hypothetical protein [Idiomarina sp.]
MANLITKEQALRNFKEALENLSHNFSNEEQLEKAFQNYMSAIIPLANYRCANGTAVPYEAIWDELRENDIG